MKFSIIFCLDRNIFTEIEQLSWALARPRWFYFIFSALDSLLYQLGISCSIPYAIKSHLHSLTTAHFQYLLAQHRDLKGFLYAFFFNYDHVTFTQGFVAIITQVTRWQSQRGYLLTIFIIPTRRRKLIANCEVLSILTYFTQVVIREALRFFFLLNINWWVLFKARYPQNQ